MPHGYEGARRFEVLRFNWVMGNYQLKNTSLYTIICFTGLISSRVTGSHTFKIRPMMPTQFIKYIIRFFHD